MAVNDTRTSTVAAAPTVAYVLSLIAGVLVVLNGLLLIGVGATLGIAVFGGGLAFGVIGILLGAVIIYAAVRLNAQPVEHVSWGAIIKSSRWSAWCWWGEGSSSASSSG
jgi:hypothetical protein